MTGELANAYRNFDHAWRDYRRQMEDERNMMDDRSATRSALSWEPSTHNHDPSHLAFARRCYAEGYAAGVEAALEASPLRGTRMVLDEAGEHREEAERRREEKHRRFVECW